VGARWASTGRKTTTKDGARRTVYRDAATGALATKRVSVRKGKRVARYVKL